MHVYLVSSVIMGFDYFSDRVSCMVPKESPLSKDFIHSVCWISGIAHFIVTIILIIYHFHFSSVWRTSLYFAKRNQYKLDIQLDLSWLDTR